VEIGRRLVPDGKEGTERRSRLKSEKDVRLVGMVGVD
jgi:hypothetical protein